MAEGITVEDVDQIDIFTNEVKMITSSGHNDLRAGDLTIRFGNGTSYKLAESDIRASRDEMAELGGKEVQITLENGELSALSIDGRSLYENSSMLDGQSL